MNVECPVKGFLDRTKSLLDAGLHNKYVVLIIKAGDHAIHIVLDLIKAGFIPDSEGKITKILNDILALET